MQFDVIGTNTKSTVVVKKECCNKIVDYIDVSKKVMIITDDNIPRQLKHNIISQFKNPYVFEIPYGERSKNITMYTTIVDKMLKENFSRKDMVVALGGGVVGDLAGFIASTYKRGCSFVSLPTTTLAQIDSSIGAKNAININDIKNCIGNFYHPEVVLVDINTLKTLPKRHFNNGMVEAVKMGCIYDKSIFEIFKNENQPITYQSHQLEQIIIKSLLAKSDIVQKDERETQLRKILNYGHTIGHALESSHNLQRLYHGECVANGMILVQDNIEILKDLFDIFRKMEIPLVPSVQMNVKNCLDFIKNDKKADGNIIDVVKVNKIGCAYIDKTSIDSFEKYMEKKYEEYYR